MNRSLSFICKAKGKPSARSLEALADRMSGAFAFSWRKGITRFGARVDRDSMERAVRSRDYSKVIATIPWAELPKDLNAFATTASATVQGGAGWGIREVVKVFAASARGAQPQGVSADLQQRLRLTTDNPLIANYVESRVGGLVQNVTDSLQATIQAAVSNASAGFGSPRDIANTLIDKQLALNDRQAAALTKYSATLRENLGSTPQADKLIDRYASQLQQQRAMMIGRTESSLALNYGQQQVWQEAIKDGLLTQNSKREWVTETDPCDVCLQLNGQVVGIDEPFVGDDGDEYEVPAHPSCRCTTALLAAGDGP